LLRCIQEIYSAAVGLRGEVEEAVEEQRKQQMAAAMAAAQPKIQKLEPPDLPATGYFSLREIYRDSAYASYNDHSQREILRAAQTKLKQLGYYFDSADGAMGRGPQQAILDWQFASRLKVTGRLDTDSLSALGLTGRAQTYPPAPKSKVGNNDWYNESIEGVEAQYRRGYLSREYYEEMLRAHAWKKGKVKPK
jgi:hypothetical protein